jgi:hypothetical protein
MSLRLAVHNIQPFDHNKPCLSKPKLKGVLSMREGLIPAVLGTVVSASGAALLSSKYKLAATGILGFGLAHLVLGAIDLVEHR